MPRGRSKEDRTILEMALVGYLHERERIESKIEELQKQLKGKPAAAAPKSKRGGKRVLSAAARNRIAAAQKKRWAEHRKRLAAAQQ
jgi:cell division septum initiation protein DivIVA